MWLSSIKLIEETGEVSPERNNVTETSNITNVIAWLRRVTDDPNGTLVQGNEDGEVTVVLGFYDSAVPPSDQRYLAFPDVPEEVETADLLDALAKPTLSNLTVPAPKPPNDFDSRLTPADVELILKPYDIKTEAVDDMTGRELREFVDRINKEFSRIEEQKARMSEMKNILRSVIR